MFRCCSGHTICRESGINSVDCHSPTRLCFEGIPASCTVARSFRAPHGMVCDASQVSLDTMLGSLSHKQYVCYLKGESSSVGPRQYRCSCAGAPAEVSTINRLVLGLAVESPAPHRGLPLLLSDMFLDECCHDMICFLSRRVQGLRKHLDGSESASW